MIPLVLGGAVAAALGAGAMYLSVAQGWIAPAGDESEALAAITTQSGRIDALAEQDSALSTEIGAIREELSRVPALVETLRAGLPEEGALEALSDRLDTLSTRLAQIEVQPIPEAELPQEVVDAYEARLQGMQAALDERLSEMQADLAAELERIAAESDAAAALERRAADSANAAAARAALAEIEAALDTGVPFATPLAELAERTGTPVPDTLSGVAAGGVPTLAALRAGFPDAARAALDAATRAAAEAGEVGGLTAFLRTQLGARSLEPREGDDPDAVLSRAEAALNAGDLAGTLAELAMLPEAGRAELAGWTTDAETRRSAAEAVAALAAAMNSN